MVILQQISTRRYDQKKRDITVRQEVINLVSVNPEQKRTLINFAMNFL